MFAFCVCVCVSLSPSLSHAHTLFSVARIKGARFGWEWIGIQIQFRRGQIFAKSWRIFTTSFSTPIFGIHASDADVDDDDDVDADVGDAVANVRAAVGQKHLAGMASQFFPSELFSLIFLFACIKIGNQI